MKYLEIALIYYKIIKCNVLPLRGKQPTINWKVWQDKNQTEEDIKQMDWNNSTGVGVVMGINDLRCFDLDKVKDVEIVKKIIQDFELAADYSWVVQSGSGEGFHIYFVCPEPEDEEERINFYKKLGGEKAVYKFFLNEDEICHHIELRWKDCQTALPPSKHLSGGIYSFLHKDPKETPSIIDINKIIDFIKNNCKTEVQPEAQEQKEVVHNYDEERLASAIEYLSKNLPENSYDDWLMIGFGLASIGKDGEEYFIQMSLDNPNYRDNETELRKKFAGLLKDYDGTTTLGSVFFIAEKYGWKKPAVHFWVLDKQGRIKINRTRFKRFLESEGHCKLKKDGGYLFVRIVNSIVREIDSIQVKDFVMDYLYSLPAEEFESINRSEIIDCLIKGASQYFTNQFFEFLITKEIEFKRDTSTEGFLFYKNGYVSVTAEKIILKNYNEMDGCIWEKQIIQRDFLPTNQRSDYEEFMHNACRKDVQRTKALKSSIGYAMHNYKDPNNAKAVIFIDEKLSEGAFGRSGKGLIINGIGKMRTVVIEDGRNFNIAKNFAFQRVNADTNILAIEDMREKFPFDRLFSIITEGLTIEKKQRDEIFIPFPESPKIIITSNYTIQGVDDSTRDRQFIVEFSDHYNKRNRPVHEFGKNFFEGWNKREWAAFDNLMMECFQLYLREGFVTYEYVNLEEKQLIDETCQEFAEFAKELKLNFEYNKKDLYENFKQDYPGFEKLSPGKFTRWLKIWGRIKEYDVMEGKSGSKRTIIFSQISKAA